jgi:hypothetical protein
MMPQRAREPVPDHVVDAWGAVQSVGCQVACGVGLFATLLIGAAALDAAPAAPPQVAVRAARDEAGAASREAGAAHRPAPVTHPKVCLERAATVKT